MKQILTYAWLGFLGGIVFFMMLLSFQNATYGQITWTRISNNGIRNNTWIQSDNSGNLYSASNGGGFAKSRDHGVTWRPFNSGSSSPCHVAIGLNDIGEIISGSMHDINITACGRKDPHDFLRLVRNGNTWTPVKPPPGTNPIFEITFAVSDSTTLAGGSGVLPFFSTTHGASWRKPTIPPPFPICGEKLGLAVSPNDTVSVALADCAPYFSTDRGVTWAVYPQGNPFPIPPFEDNFNYTLPDGSIMQSWSGGTLGRTYCYGPQPPPNGSWTRCATGIRIPNGFTSCVTGKTGVVICHQSGLRGRGCGIYSTIDNAKNWILATKGLPFNRLNAPCGYPLISHICIDPRGFVYALGQGGN